MRNELGNLPMGRDDQRVKVGHAETETHKHASPLNFKVTLLIVLWLIDKLIMFILFWGRN